MSYSEDSAAKGGLVLALLFGMGLGLVTHSVGFGLLGFVIFLVAEAKWL